MQFDAGALLAQYRAGNDAAVLHATSELARDASAVEGWRIRAYSLARTSAAIEAAAAFLFCALCGRTNHSPHASDCLVNAAVALQRGGYLALARSILASDIEARSGSTPHPQSAPRLLDTLGAQPSCRLSVLAKAASTPSLRVRYLQEVIDGVVEGVRAGALAGAATSDLASVGGNISSLPTLSVVVCSNRDDRFGRFAAHCEIVFGRDAFELIRIDNARSMAEGYARGAHLASGNALVFCHDDVTFLSPRFRQRLHAALAGCDLLALVGATRLAGPTWFSAGRLCTRGSVTVPRRDGSCSVHWAGWPQPGEAIAVADGFFLAMPRETLRHVDWSNLVARGFHGYDVEFTQRAERAGLRVRLSECLQVVHDSEGNFDAEWHATAEAVCAALGVTTPAVEIQPVWASAHLYSTDEARAVFEAMLVVMQRARVDWPHRVAMWAADAGNELAALRSTSSPVANWLCDQFCAIVPEVAPHQS